MADFILYSVFDIYLIGIATLLTFITAIRYFGLAKRKENPNEKSINSAYAWIFVFLTIYLFLLTLSFFYIEGDYIGHIYWGNFDNPSLIHVWLAKGAFISLHVTFIFYFYTYEKILNKRIHLAPFAMIFIIILFIFLPYELVMYQLLTYTLAIFLLYFFHTLFTLMKKSQRELRAATSFIIIGTLFMSLSSAYMSPAFLREGGTPILISPALWIFGTFLCLSPTVFNPKFFSRNIKYWYFFSIILISLVIVGINIGLIIPILSYFFLGDVIVYRLDFQITLVLTLIFIIFFTIECVILIRFIKREDVLGAGVGIGVRGIFNKPEKITEEEVSISKEKKICLVCKGKVLGFETFICSNCETFYCHKCARALIDLENACWSCNAPIDKSKPVKLTKKEEEKVIVEEKNKKRISLYK